MSFVAGQMGDVIINYLSPDSVLNVEKIKLKRVPADGLAGDMWLISSRNPDPITIKTMTWANRDDDSALNTQLTAEGYIGTVQTFTISWAGSAADAFLAKVLGVSASHIPCAASSDGEFDTMTNISWTVALTRQ